MNKLTGLVIFVILAGLLSGCATPQPRSTLEVGEPALRSGEVLFEGLDGNLYVASGPDTLLQLTDLEGGGTDLAISAYAWSGSGIVFSTQNVGSETVTGAVYHARPGSSTRRLVRIQGFAPFFLYPTPDGSRVAYLGSLYGSGQLRMGSISTNGDDAVVHGTGQPFYGAWAPDGLTFLTHVGAPFSGQGSQLRLQSIAELVAGADSALDAELETAGFQAPAYSPDGEHVALALRSEDQGMIALADAGLEQITRLATINGVAAFGWSPTGHHLAWIDGQPLSTGGIAGELFTMDPDTGWTRQVTERAIAFFWSPDGTQLLVMEPFLVGPSRNGEIFYRIAVFAPATGETTYVALLRPSQAFVSRIVPFFDQYHRAYTIWSPDSRQIVLNAEDSSGNAVVHLLDLGSVSSGRNLAVSFVRPVQSTAEYGLITQDGVTSRMLSYGTNPFFSHFELSNREPL